MKKTGNFLHHSNQENLKVKTGKLIIGIILLIIGAFYSLLPHTIHMSSGVGFGLTHGVHLTIGIIALVIGVVVLIIGRK